MGCYLQHHGLTGVISKNNQLHFFHLYCSTSDNEQIFILNLHQIIAPQRRYPKDILEEEQKRLLDFV